MNFFLPDLKALCLSENANVTMHNVLPPRGALVRDSKAWADYLTEAMRLYGDRTDVMFVSHGWPRWGGQTVMEYVSAHRDAYKYLHDQTVRLMNQGLTAPEIAERIALPAALAKHWFNRGYYGSMSHNSKAVYQRYLGWYDANPAHLNGWPPEEAAKRYVAAMGGPKKALKQVEKAFRDGDYRWSAEVANHIVFAGGDTEKARELLAKSYEQMGYQSESMLWRNMYLTGAMEARQAPTEAVGGASLPRDYLAATTTPQLFDLLAVRVDPEKAVGKETAVAFVFPERNERAHVQVRNSVLVHQSGEAGPVRATLTLPRAAFIGIVFAGAKPADLIASGTMKVEGDPAALAVLFGVLDVAQPAPPFAIVTP